MADMTLDEVYRAAIRLSPEEQDALVARLQAARGRSGKVTRESILAEFKRRKAAGLFPSESLRNKYANPEVDTLTDEQLREEIHKVATEWKQDLNGDASEV